MSLASRFILAFSLLSIAAFGCKSDDDTDPECISLCERTPTATAVQAGCVSDFIERRGYDTDHPDCVQLANAFVAGSATAAMCRACYESIEVSGVDCAAAEDACFGVPPDSGPGDSGTDVGMMDAGDEDAGRDAAVDVGIDVGADAPMIDVGMDGGPPDIVDDCRDLCMLTGSTDMEEAACAVGAAEELGYDVDTDECNALALAYLSGSASRPQCTACYSSMAMSDEDCRSLYFACY